jgi:hypothetical protein
MKALYVEARPRVTGLVLVRCWAVCIVAMILLTLAAPAHAASIDVSGVNLSSLSPNPVAPGQHLTSFGYVYDVDNLSSFTASVRFTLELFLSANTTFGDEDDFSLGTTTTGLQQFPGFTHSHISSTTSNPNGFPLLSVPRLTQPGVYNAFIEIVPVSPHLDPTPGDAFGPMVNPVIVQANVELDGDFDTDCQDVFATDLCCGTDSHLAWRDQNRELRKQFS